MANEQNSGGGFFMTADDLQKLLSSAMAAAVSEARKMTPLESRKYNEEVEKERRRDRMGIELSKAEEINQRNKMYGCSHRCDPKTGLAVGGDRQDALWTTGGQLHGNDLATLSCMRCGWRWTWKTNAQEREYINNAGMLRMAPPPKAQVDLYLKEVERMDRASMMKEELPVKAGAGA